MVGQAFNPNSCAYIANQALNSNQGGAVPYTSNLSNHNVLWDFDAEKLLWVNTLTGLIEAEIPGSNSCDFKADINYVGASESIFTYTCVPANGVAPFTYQWGIKTAPYITHTIVGSSTSQNLDLEATGPLGSGTSTIRCKVTDSEGCITTAYFYAFYIPVL